MHPFTFLLPLLAFPALEPRPDPGPDPTVVAAAERGATIRPELVVEVDDGVTHLTQGEGVTYTLTVGNDSPASYDDVVVSQLLPHGVRLHTAEGADTAESGQVTWLVSLLPGERAVLTVTGSVGEGEGSLVATACVAPGPGRPLSACDSDDDAFRPLPAHPGWAPVATAALTGIVVTGSAVLLRLRWKLNDARRGGKARRWRLI